MKHFHRWHFFRHCFAMCSMHYLFFRNAMIHQKCDAFFMERLLQLTCNAIHNGLFGEFLSAFNEIKTKNYSKKKLYEYENVYCFISDN